MTALFMVCWIGSSWYYLNWVGEDELWSVGCADGTLMGWFLEAGRYESPATFHFDKADSPGAFQWGSWGSPFDPIRVSGVWCRFYGVPLWVPLLIASGTAFVAWKLDRTATLRARNNCCKKCGYHRAGLKADALCPECSTPPGSD